MTVGELIDKFFIDKLEVPAKFSDGSNVEICFFNITLHGNDFEVQNIHVFPLGVSVEAKVAKRSV